MMLAVDGLFDPGTLAVLQEAAGALAFGEGTVTAGALARRVKANDQAVAAPERDALLAKVSSVLAVHPVFVSAARPHRLSPLIVSRYREGQAYGIHVDDALMQGMRTDLSFTLFLSDPKSYDGGALVIEDSLEARAVKLEAGAMILYPSTTLHRVEPATRGVRLAVVGWVQSRVRDAGQREILFDLDRSIAQLDASKNRLL
jgi:PKHD-type hydroxylase